MALEFHGFSIAQPVNRLRAGVVAFAQNVRQLIKGAFGMRNVLSGAIVTLSAAVVTIQRLNDSTPNGPPSGYVLISADANGSLWCGATSNIFQGTVSIPPFSPSILVTNTDGYWGGSLSSNILNQHIGFGHFPADFTSSGPDGVIEVSDLGFSLATGTTILGISVSLNLNASAAGVSSVTVQPTISGSPVGSGIDEVLGIPVPSVAVTLGAAVNSSSLFSTSSYASVTFPYPVTELTVSNLGFNIPNGVTILGIEVSINQYASTNFPASNVLAELSGTAVSSYYSSSFTTYPQVNTFGSPTDPFSYAGFTPANINSGLGFKIHIAGTATTGNGYINSFQVTVYYTGGSQTRSSGTPSSGVFTFGGPTNLFGYSGFTASNINTLLGFQITGQAPSTDTIAAYQFQVTIYCIFQNKLIATGLSGNPVSMIPFRPNASVQSLMYIGDSAPDGNVTINTKYALNNIATTFACSGMLKVRSDGLVYKTGIKEPQLAPAVSTQNTSVNLAGTLLATAIPWTNYNGVNSSYSYGETNGYPKPSPDGTAPFVINVLNATTVTINSLTGTATINGGSATPTTAGPSSATATNPGHYTMKQDGSGTTPASANPSVVIGAFCDGSGNVVAAGVVPLYIAAVVDAGASIGSPITVPYGAATFQIGINSTGNTFSSNSGSFTLAATVTTNSLPSVTSIIGNMTAYYWGDSPTTGPVASYIWKNPDDASGSGPTRSISSAVGSTTGNSLIFDATFTAGIPGTPGIGNSTIPMTWFQLNPQDVVVGSYPVYSPAIKGVDGNTQYANFNFCLTGNLFFPFPGSYTVVLTYEDDIIFGFGGGISLVSSTGSQLAYEGQTITVVGGYPLIPRVTGSGGSVKTTRAVINVPSTGSYPLEIDFDYWYHSGRILLVTASPTPGAGATIIPPLPVGVREDTVYWGKYRSSLTGAVSNPSPPSTAQLTPVLANQVSLAYSPDPQVDKCDYYRQDSGLSNPTYVATGPNDNGGSGGFNTAITDSLSDLAAADNPTMDRDDFEPFPSIDLPAAGIVSVSGGVITWISGTLFNVRWLAGTIIEIGSPTQLAYTLIARPTSNTSITIPGVPDGSNLVYNISQPILAAQPLSYLFGPTDNYVTMHGVGDPLRPGVDYWTKGNNFDSAPDTNQEDVTSPSEALVNGAMSGGVAALGSISRFWIIAPNQFNALETVNGTEGSVWTYRLTPITRGLYMPRCLAVFGGGVFAFRVEDGIHLSPGGSGSKSITDEVLYPIFPHEGSTPTSVTRAGVTIYPPDDTKPQEQQFAAISQFLYWDYTGIDGEPHTLVFDVEAMGWIWDVYAVGIPSPAIGGSANSNSTASPVVLSEENFPAVTLDANVVLTSGGSLQVLTSGIYTIALAFSNGNNGTLFIQQNGVTIVSPTSSGNMTNYVGQFALNANDVISILLGTATLTALGSSSFAVGALLAVVASAGTSGSEAAANTGGAVQMSLAAGHNNTALISLNPSLCTAQPDQGLTFTPTGWYELTFTVSWSASGSGGLGSTVDSFYFTVTYGGTGVYVFQTVFMGTSGTSTFTLPVKLSGTNELYIQAASWDSVSGYIPSTDTGTFSASITAAAMESE